MNNSKKITMIMAVLAVAVMAIAAFAVILPDQTDADGKVADVYRAKLNDTSETPIEDLYDTYTVEAGEKVITISATGLKEHKNGQGNLGFWTGVAFVPTDLANTQLYYYRSVEAPVGEIEYENEGDPITFSTVPTGFQVEDDVEVIDGVAFYYTPASEKLYLTLKWVVEGQGDVVVTYKIVVNTVDAKLVEDGVTTYYSTLVDAVKAAKTGTVTLLRDCSGAGIFVADGEDKNIIIDLNGFTYTGIGPAVGSKGTETQAWHLEKGNTIEIKNGTITSTVESESGVKMLVQNYCNLTLTDVIADGSNLSSGMYTVSNNFGSLTLSGNTIIKVSENGKAFDLWYGMAPVYKDGVTVTIDSTFTGTITGIVEYGRKTTDVNPDAGTWEDVTVLTFEKGNKGTFNITLRNGGSIPWDHPSIFVNSGSFSDSSIIPYLTSTADVTLIGNVTIATNMTVPAGAEISISAEANVSITGSLTLNATNEIYNAGTITLSNATGVALYNNGGTITGPTDNEGKGIIEIVGKTSLTTLEFGPFSIASGVLSNQIIKNSMTEEKVPVVVSTNTGGTITGDVTISNNDFVMNGTDSRYLLKLAGIDSYNGRTAPASECMVTVSDNTFTCDNKNQMASCIQIGANNDASLLEKVKISISGNTYDVKGYEIDTPAVKFSKTAIKVIVGGTVIGPSFVDNVKIVINDVSNQVGFVKTQAAAKTNTIVGTMAFDYLGMEAKNTSNTFTLTFGDGVTAADVTINEKGALKLSDGSTVYKESLTILGTVTVSNVEQLNYFKDEAVELNADITLTSSIIDGKVTLNGHTLTIPEEKTYTGYIIGADNAKVILDKLGPKGSTTVVIEPGSVKISGTMAADVTITLVDGKIKVSGDTSGLTIVDDGTGELVIDGDLTISSGTLSIEEGVSVTVNSGVTVTNNGTISNAGTIDNGGTITNAKTINNSGEIINNNTISNTGSTSNINNKDGATIINNKTIDNAADATITNESGAAIANNSDAEINNEGTINNDAGASIDNSGDINNSGAGKIDGDGDMANGTTSKTIVKEIEEGNVKIILGEDAVISADAKNEDAVINLYNTIDDAYYSLSIDTGIEVTATIVGKDGASITLIDVTAGAGGIMFEAGSVIISGTIASGDFIISGDTEFVGATITGDVTYTVDTASVSVDVVDLTVTGNVEFIFDEAAEFNVIGLTNSGTVSISGIISGTIATGEYIINDDTTFDGAIVAGLVTFTASVDYVTVDIADLEVTPSSIATFEMAAETTVVVGATAGNGTVILEIDPAKDVTMDLDSAVINSNLVIPAYGEVLMIIDGTVIGPTGSLSIEFAEDEVNLGIDSLIVSGAFEATFDHAANIVVSNMTVSGEAIFEAAEASVADIDDMAVTGSVIFNENVVVYGVEWVTGSGSVSLKNAVVASAGTSTTKIKIATTGDIYIAKNAKNFNLDRIKYYDNEGYVLQFETSPVITPAELDILTSSITLYEIVIQGDDAFDAFEIPYIDPFEKYEVYADSVLVGTYTHEDGFGTLSFVSGNTYVLATPELVAKGTYDITVTLVDDVATIIGLEVPTGYYYPYGNDAYMKVTFLYYDAEEDSTVSTDVQGQGVFTNAKGTTIVFEDEWTADASYVGDYGAPVGVSVIVYNKQAGTTNIIAHDEFYNTYDVTWKNYNDDVLETDLDVDYGETPSYSGLAPTKPDTETEKFTFLGWNTDKDAEEALNLEDEWVHGDVTYWAIFSSTQKYTVTLTPGDGYTLAAKPGSVSPVLKGGNYSFTFELEEGYTQSAYVIKVNGVAIEYDEELGYYTIEDIAENKVVTVEDVVKNTYTVTITVNDPARGSVDKTTVMVEHGIAPATDENVLTLGAATVTATPADPTVESVFSFGSWSGVPGTITENVTITAVFNATPQTYTVTLTPGEGYTLAAKPGSESPVDYGGEFSFVFELSEGYTQSDYVIKVNGVAITYDEELGYYTIEDIAENKVVTVEDVAKNTYTVTIEVNYPARGSVDKTTVMVEHGTAPATTENVLTLGAATVTATAAAPTVASVYSFDSWSGVPVTITENVTITANFNEAPQTYTVTLTPGDGYTLTPKAGSVSPVDYGGEFSFVFALEEGYTQSAYIIKVDGEPITYDKELGYYTIEGIAKNTVVTVEGVVKNTYTVTIEVNNPLYGSVNKSTVMVEHGTAPETTGNVLTLGAATVTATPADPTVAHVYSFVNWTGVPGTITENVTITANFNEAAQVYTVTLTPGEGYTLAAKPGSVSPVAYGGEFSFVFTLLTGYTQSEYTIKVDGEPIAYDEELGYYTIEDIAKNTVVTVEGVVKNTYTVTIEVNNALYGSVDKTTVMVEHGIAPETTENVLTLGEAIVTATPADETAAHVYSFVNWTGVPVTITENVTITANFNEAAHTYTVTLTPGEGYTLAAKPGSESPVDYGEDFSFVFTLLTGYTQSEYTIKVDGEPIAYDEELGYYTIEDIAKNVVVTVEGVELNTYTVSFAPNDEDWGTFAHESISVVHGTAVTKDANSITIGDVTVTATPSDPDVYYTYSFAGDFAGVGATVTESTTVVANFVATPVDYTLTIYKNDKVIGEAELAYGEPYVIGLSKTYHVVLKDSEGEIQDEGNYSGDYTVTVTGEGWKLYLTAATLS